MQWSLASCTNNQDCSSLGTLTCFSPNLPFFFCVAVISNDPRHLHIQVGSCTISLSYRPPALLFVCVPIDQL